jgi:hypothetical protein
MIHAADFPDELMGTHQRFGRGESGHAMWQDDFPLDDDTEIWMTKV